jgi:uncharacterized protein (UPF0332 family)
MSAVATPLERGREEVRAAEVLLEAGFPSQAVARAYTGAFQAAQAALFAIGEAPATPAGVLSAFTRHVVDESDLDHDHARALRKLFEDQYDVDLGLANAPEPEARAAIAAARGVVDATARWIELRAQG